MNLLIVAATPFEIAPLAVFLEKNFQKTGAFVFQKENFHVHTLITGVGLPLTAYAMGRYLGTTPVDFAINAGIAGAFDRNLQLGTVVHVVEDSFADLGIEQADGTFQDLFENELIAPTQPPFSQGKLTNPTHQDAQFLPKVKGISVNKVHGNASSIAAFRQKNPTAQVESMEGAAFHYVCLQEQLPFLQIRSISNYVEKRDKSKWQIGLAIENLNQVLIDMLSSFTQK